MHLKSLRSGAEANGEEVGVVHAEAQAHGFADEAGEVGATVPGYDAADFVADDFGAVVEGEAFYLIAVSILNLDPDTSGGAGGVIDLEFLTGESEGLGQQLAAVVGGADRGEAVEAQDHALEAGGFIGVVPLDVE